jgi:hypothetical protein
VLAALALVALAAGVAMAVRQWSLRPKAPHPAPVVRDIRESMPHDSIHARFARASSDEEKSRWRDEVPGADLAGLTPARREIFLRLVNTRRCTCGCGYTLAACRAYDTSCEKSLPKVTALLDSVAHGWIADAAGARTRPASVR